MTQAKRAIVEFALDADDMGRLHVGTRTLYHYWTVLQSYFRSVLVPPQRRTDSQNIAWIWSEKPEAGLPSAEELKTLRRKLSDAHRQFVDAVSTGRSGAALAEEDGEQLCSRMGRVVANLVAKPDRELIGYTASTAQGWMIHSWGSSSPGEVQHPDDRSLAISGRARQGASSVPGVTVSLYDAEDREVDRSRTDSAGFFVFPKLSAGRYRVAVSETRAGLVFSEASAALSSESVKDLDLLAEETAKGIQVADTRPPLPKSSHPASASGTHRWLVWVLVGLLVGGVIWVILHRSGSDSSTARVHEDRGKPNVAGSVGGEVGSEAQAGSVKDSHQDPLEEKRLRATRASRTAEQSFQSNGASSLGSGAPALGDGSSLAPNSASAGDAQALGGGSQSNSSPESPNRAQAKPSKAATPQVKAPSSGKAQVKPWAKIVAVTADSTPPSATKPEAEAGPGPENAGTPEGPVARPDQKPTENKGKPDSKVGSPPKAQPDEADEPSRHDADATDEADARSAADDPSSQAASKPSGSSSTSSGAPNSQPSSEARDAQNPTTDAIEDPNEHANAEEAPASVPTAASQAPASSAARAGTQPKSAGRSKTSSSPNPSHSEPAAEERGAAPSGEAAGVERGDGATQPAPEENPDQGQGFASESDKPLKDRPWGPVVHLHLRPWAQRLAVDEIVPTAPVADGEPDEAGKLREVLWSKRVNAMPHYFRQPLLMAGLSLGPFDASMGERQHWSRTAPRTTVAEAPAVSGRIELRWPATRPLTSQTWTLRAEGGTDLAIVRFTAMGDVYVRQRQGVRARYWIGMDKPTTNDALPGLGKHLHWRTDAGVLPDSWKEQDDWQEGRGMRLLLPLDGADFSGRWVIQLLDTNTGWSLAGDVQIESPVTR